MQHAWGGYEKYAWGFDELCPLSQKGEAYAMRPATAARQMCMAAGRAVSSTAARAAPPSGCHAVVCHAAARQLAACCCARHADACAVA